MHSPTCELHHSCSGHIPIVTTQAPDAPDVPSEAGPCHIVSNDDATVASTPPDVRWAAAPYRRGHGILSTGAGPASSNRVARIVQAPRPWTGSGRPNEHGWWSWPGTGYSSRPMHSPERDPEQVREAHALRAAFTRFATLEALHASPEWPALEARLSRLLSRVRTSAPERSASPGERSAQVRVVQWNIEHGNRFEEIARALAGEPALRAADIVTLNEVDLGMARSGNRDVAGELAARLGLHSAWGPLFLESTRGRDDDLLTALPEDNAESLFGLAVLSRWPITAVRLVALPGPEQALFERERMAGRFIALACDIAHPVTPFVAVTVHLEVHRTRAHRATQMRLLLAALERDTRPVLLTGDWNTHTFDRGERHAVLAAAWPLLAWPGGALSRRLRYPDAGPHRELLFEHLRAAGFEWEPISDRAPTLDMRFSRLGEVHAMPGPLRALASRGLAWVERRSRLRLDWIAARGFAPVTVNGATVAGLDGPGRASDHAPITATLSLPQA